VQVATVRTCGAAVGAGCVWRRSQKKLSGSLKKLRTLQRGYGFAAAAKPTRRETS